MKYKLKAMAIATVSASLALGLSQTANADVYGLAATDIDNLTLQAFNNDQSPPDTSGLTFGFTTDAEASLNGIVDPSAALSECGTFSGPCGAPPIVLSGQVQNAPGNDAAGNRAENDAQTEFGTQNGVQYSNAESVIVDAQLAGGTATNTEAIAEANLITGSSAAGNTTVDSGTNLTWVFTIPEGGGNVFLSFDAEVDIVSDVNSGDNGLVTSAVKTGLTLSKVENGSSVEVVAWNPDGISGNITTVDKCAAGLTCTDTEASTALNVTHISSLGEVATRSGGPGQYSLLVQGLDSGTYAIGLNNTGSVSLGRQQVPVPATLFLMGAGLLGMVRFSSRKKSA